MLPVADHPRSTVTMEMSAATEELIRRGRAVIAKSADLRRSFQDVKVQGEALRISTYDLAKVRLDHLVPLVVEDDPDHAFFLKRSFKKQHLPFPLPLVGNGEEAIQFLSGKAKYRDLARYRRPPW